ncbi:MULE transposase [Hirsutella rhossiliensis]
MESVYYREFDTKEAAQAACHAVAKAQGFALVIRSGEGQRLLYDLLKGRRRSGCPFRLTVKKRRTSGAWTPVPSPSSRDHDHPFTPAVTHSGYRAELIAEHHGHIVGLYNTGLKPFQIATHLRGLALIKNPDLKFITGQHIRNAIAAYRVRELAGRTPLQFLYDQLKDLSLGFFFRDTRDQEGRLTGLFIAPRTGIELWRRFPNILLLDCTGRGSSTAVNAADVTRQALEYIYANGDSYEPGTEMPRAYQRHRTPDSDNELAGAGETQGTIHCYQATQQATQWNTQRITMPSTHRGHKEEDTEDEDDPLADFDMMDEEMEEEECLREELHKEGLL